MVGKKIRAKYGGCILEGNLRIKDKGFRVVCWLWLVFK